MQPWINNWLDTLQYTVYTVHNTLIGTNQEPISIAVLPRGKINGEASY